MRSTVKSAIVSGADGGRQPGSGEVSRPFDDVVGVRCHGSSTKSHPPSSRQGKALPRPAPLGVRIELEMRLAVEHHHCAVGVGVDRPVVTGVARAAE